MLMYQEVSEGYFLKTSSPFPDFSCRPFLKKLGFHFLETLKCCRAKQKKKNPKPIKIMKLEMEVCFTAYRTMSK